MIKIQIYSQARPARYWRWRVVARNGYTIAESPEFYFRKQDAERAAKNLIRKVAAATGGNSKPRFLTPANRAADSYFLEWHPS